ncbi:hypothetical protein MRX96_058598 [Rhipicephalus microplus]|uniref:Uncharacterized protein n=1 Tax=Rhipicephalus microplus TaxID=6941 RepID=A0A9J6D8R9_RHIMP|nr:hypothetical protein HPB51_008175 [Rhipicephalus microplus]
MKMEHAHLGSRTTRAVAEAAPTTSRTSLCVRARKKTRCAGQDPLRQVALALQGAHGVIGLCSCPHRLPPPPGYRVHLIRGGKLTLAHLARRARRRREAILMKAAGGENRRSSALMVGGPAEWARGLFPGFGGVGTFARGRRARHLSAHFGQPRGLIGHATHTPLVRAHTEHTKAHTAGRILPVKRKNAY